MSVGNYFAPVVRLGVVKRMGGAKVCELLEEMQWYTPLSGFRDTGYAECVCAGDIADDGFVVGECDNVAGGNDVVHTDECCAVSIWYYGERVGSDMGCFFDGFCFHVAVADGCSRWCWADVRFPFGGIHKEATGGSCQHCTAV